MSNDVMKSGNVAVVTGGAAGIGLAAAQRFAKRGMTVVVVDVRGELFPEAEASLREAGAPEVMTRAVDVANRAAVDAFRDEVIAAYGHIDLLMCNAGIQPGSDIFDSKQTWARVLEVNLWGVVNCCQSIVPGMIERGRPAIVINTGSKQGITTPPGNPAYNVSKAGVKAATEALQHELRNTEGCKISAHLLVPGFVYTGMVRQFLPEKPESAWLPEQVVEFLVDALDRGDFYVICPDNDVSRAEDNKRMAWAMGDIIENRPPLSRWHPDFQGAFESYMKE